MSRNIVLWLNWNIYEKARYCHDSKQHAFSLSKKVERKTKKMQTAVLSTIFMREKAYNHYIKHPDIAQGSPHALVHDEVQTSETVELFPEH